MSRNRLLIAGAAVSLGLVVVIGAILLTSQPPPVTSQATPLPTPTPLPTASLAPSPSLAPTPSPTPAPPSPLLGLDGRFTMLLLGTDYRPAHPGNRTDTIMIVSISPVDGSTVGVSIPRDTARFPLPDGTIHRDKINTLYQKLVSRLGRADAGTEMRRIFGETLGVEIDAYALIGMFGVIELIQSIGGVDVHLETAVLDPYYWVNNHTQGVYFPAGDIHLNGERALIFARTRKGDSDFQRVRRQQLLVLAAGVKVVDRGLDALPALLKLGERWVTTDLPLDEAPAIFLLISGADLENARTDVFGPRYATKIPGSVNYELNMTKVRAKIAAWFAPVPGSPLGPPIPTIAPTPSTSPSP